MNLETLKKSGCIIFECISGSRAYGLATPTSDTDIRGVFILPREQYYSLNVVEQINNESNDIVYYELKRFIELLKRNNPNMLELLNMPEDCIQYTHPLYELIRKEMFLSRLCEQSFANYAWSQIKKARGLNKKIMNPQEKERKSIMDFCYVYEGKSSLPLKEFLQKNRIQQERCGLAVVPHMTDCYNLFHSYSQPYKGILHKGNSNEVSLSSIPKGELPIGLLFFNRNAYSSYCKDYKEYWEWEEKRNEERYKTNIAHEKNYDSKNLMHTFRLLLMAEEIAKKGDIIVRRPDREFLLDIKAGKFDYEDLLEKATQKKEALGNLFEASPLPVQPNEQKIDALLIEIRSRFYQESYGN